MQQKSQLATISAIRFGFYGARKLAAMGYADIARHFRATARKHVAALRVLRREAA